MASARCVRGKGTSTSIASPRRAGQTSTWLQKYGKVTTLRRLTSLPLGSFSGLWSRGSPSETGILRRNCSVRIRSVLSCCQWTFWIGRDPPRGVPPRHSYKCCGIHALDVAVSRNLQRLCNPKKPRVGVFWVFGGFLRELQRNPLLQHALLLI